jgi:hypothetical protein
VETFTFSADPQLEPKVRVVGLYLNPPANAVVLSVDEKSQTQAQIPVLPTDGTIPLDRHKSRKRAFVY